MAPPEVQFNTYVQPLNEISVDFISKIFIISEFLFGIVRLQLLGKIKSYYLYLSLTYAIIVTCLVFGMMYRNIFSRILLISTTLSLIQYAFFVFFNFITCKRLLLYYKQLNIFDVESCKLKVGTETKKNIVQMIASIIYAIARCVASYILENDQYSYMPLEQIPSIMIHILEINYVGHLLSLLTPRVRLINYYLESSLSNTKQKATDVKYFESHNKSLLKLEKLMSLYYRIVQAYDYLYDAVKWQLLVTLVVTFICRLLFCYEVSLKVIRGKGSIVHLLLFILYTLGMIMPLFSPCVQGGQLHSEVERLRELLASKLYENKLDKGSRTVARAFLAWTETRNLKFSLLRMLDVDISMPFKMTGLLFTYLIILLQFEKELLHIKYVTSVAEAPPSNK